MSFKPLATRDRRALVEEWRRRNAMKREGKKDATRETLDGGGTSGRAREVDGTGASETNAVEGEQSTETRRGGIKYDFSAMDRKATASAPGEGKENIVNESSFTTPRAKGKREDDGGVQRQRVAGEQHASTSQTTTPGSSRKSTAFSLSGVRRRSVTSTSNVMNIDSMPSPAVRARLKAVEIEKEALEALAARLRESSEAALEVAHSGKSQAEERANALSERLQKLDSERSTLESNMAAVRAQAQALLKAKEEHSRALRKEKRAAEAAVKALEQVKEEAANAVQEREFTIEAQAEMLKQLDDELDRAERSREEAELNVATKDKRLAQLEAQLKSAKRDLEVASRNRSSKSDTDGNGVRASHEKLLSLAAARQEAEAEAARARQEARSLTREVEERRQELETVQCELEKCLEEERSERRRAEEAYNEMEDERNMLQTLVEKRTLEKIELEERLDIVTAEADQLRAEMIERDEMLREGSQLVEAKEAELDSAVTYVLQLQEQLDELQATGMQSSEVAAQIAELKNHQKALQTEKDKIVADMHSELTERDALLAESKKSLEAKEAELSALRDEYGKKTTELGPLESELGSLQAKLSEFKSQLDEKEAQLEANDKRVKQLMSAEKRQNANVRRLEYGLAERDEKLRNFNEEINNLKLESEQKEEDISHRLATLEKREGELEELKRTTESRLEELRVQNAAELTRLRNEVTCAESRASELEKQLQDSQNSSSLSDSEELSGVRAELESTKAKLDASQLEIATLCTSIAELEYKAEESMSALKAELELTKEQLKAAQADAEEAQATVIEVETESASLMKSIREVGESFEVKENEYKELIQLRESEVKALKKEMHNARAKLTEAERSKESARQSVTVIRKLEDALKMKAGESERLKAELSRANKQLGQLQQELGTSKSEQKELRGAIKEMQFRFQKSEEQRDMLAGSLAKQNEYHENVNKAREEMHQIQLEDAADELRSVQRKVTTLATALQHNVRVHELDAEVALLVDQFAETLQSTPQTALPTPTMNHNEPKTKPKTYRKTPAKPRSMNKQHSKFVTPVRPEASLKENIHKLSERADQISFNDFEYAHRQPGAEVNANMYTTPGNENGSMKTAGDAKKAAGVLSAKKTRPVLGDVSQNV